MLDLRGIADERGGLIPTHRLLEEGLTPYRIAALRHAGRIDRVRQGWYVLPGGDDQVTRAARVGGQLTCASSLARHGLWVFREPHLHVAVNRSSCQLREPSDHHRRLALEAQGVVVHWRRRNAATTAMVAPIADALEDYRKCADLEHYLVAADSALHQQALLAAEVRDVLRHVSRFGLDGTCQSGTETLFWTRMLTHRLRIRRQVWIAAVGYVDFLLGSRLVVEVDGFAHHSSKEDFEVDRRRDAELSRLGYRVLRFSYHQVVNDWAAVEAAVLAAVVRGDQY